jgi:predicted anti-sigma-YlaC factor YlaD
LRPCLGRDRQFSLALDGELTPAERAEFDQHLAGCPACHAAFTTFCVSLRLLRRWPAEPFDELKAARLRRRVRAGMQAPQQRRLPSPVRVAGYVVAAAVFVVAGYVVGAHLGVGRPGPSLALPNPRPEAHLRDARTGGWLEPASLAEAVRRTRRPVELVPHVRGSLFEARDEVESRRRAVMESLTSYGLDRGDVRFLPPVVAGGTLLDGPRVEFWVKDVRPVAYATAR